MIDEIIRDTQTLLEIIREYQIRFQLFQLDKEMFIKIKEKLNPENVIESINFLTNRIKTNYEIFEKENKND